MRCGNCNKEGPCTIAYTEKGPMYLCDECAGTNNKRIKAENKSWAHDRKVDAAIILFGCLVAAGFIAAILIR